MEEVYRFRYQVNDKNNVEFDGTQDLIEIDNIKEKIPKIMRAPNIFDIVKDDLPNNFTDSDLLLDAEILQKF